MGIRITSACNPALLIGPVMSGNKIVHIYVNTYLVEGVYFQNNTALLLILTPML